MISSSTSPPNISLNVKLELFGIFGPLIFKSISGIFLFIFGLLILTFGIFPLLFIFGLLTFPLISNPGKFIFGPFISIFSIGNFPSMIPDIL